MTPDQLADSLTARLNGPHSDDATAGAARLAAEVARFLNYATRAGEGLTEPATVYSVTGNLAAALHALPQLLSQIGDYLSREFAAGNLADDYGRLPFIVIGQARADLDNTARLSEWAGRSLDAVQSAVSGLHHAAGDETR